MRHLLLILPTLSSLLLGAHLLRSGWGAAAVLIAALPLLLLVRRSWSLRLLQVALALGVFEWIRTIARLVSARRLAGAPYLRMSIILGAVVLVTLVSVPLLEAWARRRHEARA